MERSKRELAAQYEVLNARQAAVEVKRWPMLELVEKMQRLNPDETCPDPTNGELFKLTQEFDQVWAAMGAVARKLRLIDDRITCTQRLENAGREVTTAEHRLAFSRKNFDCVKREEDRQLEVFLRDVDHPIPDVTVKNAPDDADGRPTAAPISDPGGLESTCIDMGREFMGSVMSKSMAST